MSGTDQLFPSGPWTGFYSYDPKNKHRMDLNLVFCAGDLTGDGNDEVGHFTIRGQYDATSLECSWTKAYVAKHEVAYRGFREGKGIWGTWEIMLLLQGAHDHGGFHIWPTAESLTESSDAFAVDSDVGNGIELRRPPEVGE